MLRNDGSREHTVILVHGIRDFALWQTRVKDALEREGFRVEMVNYGRMNLLEFLIPLQYFRNKAIQEVWKQIRIVKQNDNVAKISVIAHSFGTYVVANLMQREFDIVFHRVIFCGSVVKYGFPFEQCQSRFAAPILNDVGTRDVWPAVAESVTTGYGSAGSYGFRRPLVKDRWHNGAGHGYFLRPEFCATYWVPFLKDNIVVPGSLHPETPSAWVQLVSIFKLKYLLFLAFIAFMVIFSSRYAFLVDYEASISIPDPEAIGSVEDLATALGKIERRKDLLDKSTVTKITLGLTKILLTQDSRVPRITRRKMNEKIVQTIVRLNGNDLSFVWKSLPPDLDLSFISFRGLDLTGVKFVNAFLIDSDFSNSQLNDATFDDARLRGASFSGARLSDASFQNSDWFNAYGVIIKDWPETYSNWFECPKDYKLPSQTAFTTLHDEWYGTPFASLDHADVARLTSSWKSYAAQGGLCDVITAGQQKEKEGRTTSKSRVNPEKRDHSLDGSDQRRASTAETKSTLPPAERSTSRHKIKAQSHSR